MKTIIPYSPAWNHFAQWAKDVPIYRDSYSDDQYVCIGHGDYNETALKLPLKDFFNNSCNIKAIHVTSKESIQNYVKSGEISFTYSGQYGTLSYLLYFVELSYWEEAMGDTYSNIVSGMQVKEKRKNMKNMKKTKYPLQKNFMEAIKLLDKYIKHNSETSYKKITGIEIVKSKDSGLSSLCAGVFDSTRENIIIRASASHSYPYDLLHECIISDYEPVKINGYFAEDDGNCVKFGCARISKSLIVESRNFLKNAAGNAEGNRTIKHVDIGAGVFSLVDLEALMKQFSLA